MHRGTLDELPRPGMGKMSIRLLTWSPAHPVFVWYVYLKKVKDIIFSIKSPAWVPIN